MKQQWVVLLAFMGITSPALAGEMFADTFQQDAYGSVTASGHVKLKTSSYELKADTVTFDIDSQAGTMEGAVVQFGESYTIKGEKLERIDLENFRGNQIEFSSCPTDEWAWSIVADEAELDRDNGVFRAKNAWFEFGGIPVLYTPYWSHALKRKSGFLIPEFSTSTVRGTEITTPYYWAAAPNWDVTLRPRWMSYRGLMSDVEWRHRSRTSSEMVQVQSIKDEKTQTQRGRLIGDVAWNPSRAVRVKLNVDAVVVEDGLYVADFPRLSEKESKAYLTSATSVVWQENRDSIALSSRYQQRLGGASNDATLQILPRVGTKNYFDMGWDGELRLDHQTTRFQRIAGYSGLRSGIRPSITIPWYMQGGAVAATWSLNGQAVGYDTAQFTQTNASYGAVASSAQLQATFERVFADKQWRHELKPIIRLDVSSAADQSSLPRYDSSLIPLSISNILSGNRYSGWDRFERMQRVSMLLVSSLQAKEGQDGARTVLQGQVGIVWDGLRESVDTTLVAAPTRMFSNTLAEVSWFPSRHISLSTGGQYNSDLDEWVEAHGSAGWSGEKGQHINASWQRTLASHSAPVESLNASARAQLSLKWATYASTQYDLLRDYSLNTIMGLAYKHACWGLSIEGFRTHKVGANNIEDAGARVLLAFDGLGSFGGG